MLRLIGWSEVDCISQKPLTEARGLCADVQRVDRWS